MPFSSEISRRTFLAASGLAAWMARTAVAADRPARVLLRSSWQTVNIGDIAHTPGVLRLLEEYLPEAEVRLWPSKIDNGVDELLQKRFPKLVILRSAQDKVAAFEECDFLLHGSGPFLVAESDVLQWSQRTGKPYGVYGITFSQRYYSTESVAADAFARTLRVLSDARFVLFRDSVSLELAKQKGCTCPILEFGPDGAFATDLADDEKASRFLSDHGLTEGQFLCCIPRLRYTPYWTIPSRNTKFDPARHARNEAMKVQDHAPLLEAIIQVTQKTPMKVLLCPEDQTQMAIGKELLLDKLPSSVRERVAWRPDYWLTGEARSTYRKSAGLFGHEMHSPILCIGAGIPAIVCRWEEQTSKGYMWRDIGLADWLFDMDQPTEVDRIVPTVLSLAEDPAAAKTKALAAKAFVEKRQKETMEVLKQSLRT